MKRRIVLTGDDWEFFRPITITRPLADVRAGAFTFRERIQRLFYDSVITVKARTMVAEAFTARTGVPTNQLSAGKGPILLLKPNAIYNMEFHDKVIKAEPGTMFTSGGLKIGALVEEKEFPNSLEELELPEIEIEVVLIPTIWDLVNTNEKAIELDYSSCFGPEKEGRINKNAVLIESASIFVGAGAKVHAGVVLDASEGPIIIDEGAVVRPGAFVEGPCYIGKDTTVVSGWIRPGCSFGRACRVGGEVEASIFQGYSNKYHEGFIGHSYIGEWVNLGALTTTSDLKNNYSEVHVDQGEGPVATGQMKVGSFIGDHTKTGIGTLLNTGTCIGVNVNHYGTGFPPKHIRSFSWGTAEGYKEYTIEKAMETARMVMSRREVEMLPEEENLLRFIHSLRK